MINIMLLTTIGRKTGKEHKVQLRGVMYNGKIYLSRRKPDGDWFKNAMACPDVDIKYNGKVLKGKAQLVTDQKLERKISMLKYPGQARATEKRTVIEIVLESTAEDT